MSGLLDKLRAPITLLLFVATLGYFVDVYDIWVFAGTRVASLKDIGVPSEKIFDTGVMLLNAQMIGMLLGGISLGVAGDKLGRTRVMFISILTYSLATLANAFINDVNSYVVLRFISGFGLAGELGLGATLICESLPKDKRGIGAGLMVSLGITGALAAGACAQLFPWRVCYGIGGVLGLILLVFRFSLRESEIFRNQEKKTERGNVLMLFSTRERALRFLCCLMLGLPTWFVYGILVTFSNEIMPALGIAAVATPILMVYCNIALPLGDMASILISQKLKSRKKVYVGFIAFATLATLALFFLPRPLDQNAVIALYFCMSFGIGAWVLMTMIATEAFGTNLRATVASSVPNFARASVVPLTLSLSLLKSAMPLDNAVLILGLLSFALPVLALSRLPETFDRSMDYSEANEPGRG